MEETNVISSHHQTDYVALKLELVLAWNRKAGNQHVWIDFQTCMHGVLVNIYERKVQEKLYFEKHTSYIYEVLAFKLVHIYVQCFGCVFSLSCFV